MKKVGLVQPNYRAGPAHLNAYYLPYSVGILWSYALTIPEIKQSFTDHVWIFRRDPADEVVSQLTECDIVFFSIYVWNKNYCYNIAKKLKSINPDVVCVFGGPEVPHSKSDLFIKYPFIDAMVVGEGEQVVADILLKFLHNEPIDKLLRSARIKDLDIPSPYLEGIFDKLIAQHTDIEWMPTLETDRGCPYQCTFCDWGSLTASKMIKFDTSRIFAELDWVGEKKLPFLTLTNSNFGVFKERDNLIADKIVQLKLAHNVPTGISVSYAKNSNADVFNIVKKFQDVGIQSGMSLSLQSTTPEVLTAIKRTNMNINNISEITNYGVKLQIPINTELIMCLPEETKETFKKTIIDTLDFNIHSSDIFLLNMIENAPIQQDVEKYQLKTFTAYDMFYETSEDFSKDKESAEGIEIVKSTSTMSEQDVVDVYLFGWFITGMHNCGITDIIASYLNKEYSVSYLEFYNALYDHLQKNTKIGSWSENISDAFDSWKQSGFFTVDLQGYSKVFQSWQITHTLMVFAQITNELDNIFKYVHQFIIDNYDVSDVVIGDYINISKNRIKTWGKYHNTPTEIVTQTNVWDYVVGNSDKLEFIPQSYLIRDRYNQFPEQIEHHVDNMIYGRRRSWILNVVDKV